MWGSWIPYRRRPTHSRHNAGEKKAPANAWHCCAVIYLGLPSPVAELAATVGGYLSDTFPATFEGLDPNHPRRKMCSVPVLLALLMHRAAWLTSWAGWKSNKRIIAVNVQGITGSKKDFTSLPYKKIVA